MTQRFHGLPAAPGVGIGNLLIYRTWHPTFMPSQVADDPNQEWQHFLAAQQAVDLELATLATDENSLIAEVFTAQRTILQDQTLTQAVQQAIFQEHQSALAATHAMIHHFADLFRDLGDDYFAGRAVDILDIGHRLLKQMGAPVHEHQEIGQIAAGTILVARDVTFSELTQLPLNHIVGIALAESTPTAHSAILARSLGIPLVCTIGDAILHLPAVSNQTDAHSPDAPGRVSTQFLTSDQPAVIDGDEGYLLVEPTPDELAAYQAKRQTQMADRASAVEHAHEPANTSEGLLVPVLANANNPEDVTLACTNGADGVGLLRTEYLFQNRLDPPTLEEQYDTYLYFATQMIGRQLTVRAFDIGGDKPMPYLIHSHEANPFLGLRGVRLLLTKPELISTQYQALWRVAYTLATGACIGSSEGASEEERPSPSRGASEEDRLSPSRGASEEERLSPSRGASKEVDLRFMLPMISTVEEVRAMRAVLTEVEARETAALSASDPRLVPKIKIGVMIEVPSAALIADRIAPLVDFFSIGTNDLAQYVLATDRTNSSVAMLADPLHPAVLRLIQLTCQAGAAAGIPVSICGEIGGDPAAIPLLLGLGLNELSVPVPAIPLVKEAVRHSTQTDCYTLANQALCCEDGRHVRSLLG